MNGKDPRKNDSGCWDFTAYEAIKKADADIERERFKKFIGCVYRIAELAGFYIDDITVKDRRTGKIWR